MRKIYEDTKAGLEIRQNLSKLRQEIKSTFLKEELKEWMEEEIEVMRIWLQSEDPKTRKNAALLAGDLSIDELLPMVYEAYDKEDKFFVKSAYLTAMQNFDCSQYLLQFQDRMEELANTVLTEENKKHVSEEMRELSALLIGLEGVNEHEFRGYKEPSDIIILTNREYMDVTMERLEEIPTLATSEAKMMAAGIRIKENCLDKILPIRTWQDILFIVEGMKTCEMDANFAAEKVAQSELLDFMKKRHKGKAPFYFRIEMKSKIPLDKKSAFVKKMGMQIEQLTGRELINSTSHYEAEIRLIENKEGRFNMLVKLFTLPDERFSYRKEVIPTSIRPVNAALLVSLAREYMIEDAQVLDPFCGVGTMLIERQKQIPANTSYGIDVMPEAIEKARVNTDAAEQIVHYINRSFFDFKHDYLFDEIFTNMPFAIGRKTLDEIYEIYERFFRVARKYLTKNGQIIMYSHNRDFVKRLVRKYDYFVAHEWMIQKKEETYLFIIRF